MEKKEKTFLLCGGLAAIILALPFIGKIIEEKRKEEENRRIWQEEDRQRREEEIKREKEEDRRRREENERAWKESLEKERKRREEEDNLANINKSYGQLKLKIRKVFSSDYVLAETTRYQKEVIIANIPEKLRYNGNEFTAIFKRDGIGTYIQTEYITYGRTIKNTITVPRFIFEKEA